MFEQPAWLTFYFGANQLKEGSIAYRITDFVGKNGLLKIETNSEVNAEALAQLALFGVYSVTPEENKAAQLNLVVAHALFFHRLIVNVCCCGDTLIHILNTQQAE